MSAGTLAQCDCQWDDHFGERPIPRTTRHAYGAQFPVTKLAAALLARIGRGQS